MIIVIIILNFLGPFHPLLVHLPIGILLLAILFFYISRIKKFGNLKPAVGISLLIGAIAATFSCITGWLLAKEVEYSTAIVNAHQWMGISVAVLSIILYFLHSRYHLLTKFLMPALALLIALTGHWGGTLTHGEGYLTQAFKADGHEAAHKKPIADVKKAIVYNDIVKPILQAKCYGCHGSARQKGKLRLDEPQWIDKGGENGKVIVAAQPGESELIKRILLPKENDEHMPPSQKPQLTKAEIALLNWWVAAGADYHKQTAELKTDEKVQPYLIALQQGGIAEMPKEPGDIPADEVAKAPEQILQQLAALNVAVIPVSKGSNYLSLNFIAVDSITNKHLALLQAVSKQIVWLKLGYTKLNDEATKLIGILPSLTRLYLNNSNVTDNSLSQLSSLNQLVYLNLSGTEVTAQGIANLKSAKQLKHLYVFQTGIKTKDMAILKKLFPTAAIDTGGYSLQFLPTDTILVKEKPKKV